MRDLELRSSLPNERTLAVGGLGEPGIAAGELVGEVAPVLLERVEGVPEKGMVREMEVVGIVGLIALLSH